MSGQLVGEVLDAIESGALKELSSVDRLALLAIAEKCQSNTRQGSVRIGRIQAAAGKSKSTAERALKRLKERGLIWVVKRGYKSHGVAKAPIYGLASLKTTEAPDFASVTQDDVSTHDVLPSFPDALPSFRDVLPSPMGDVLDGSIDGSIEGGALPQEPPTTTCGRHPNWNDWPCLNCKQDKTAYQTWLNDSRRLLADLDREADTTRRHQSDEIRNERRSRIAVFQRIGETWK